MDRIIIRNFGPVKDIDIELSKLMVFTGPQGSGKSTIAKLLTVLSDVTWWIKVCDNDNPMEYFRKIRIEKCFQPDTYISYNHKDDVNIIYQKGNFSITVKDIKPEDTGKFCYQLFGVTAKQELEKLGANIDKLEEDKIIKKHRNYLRAMMRLAYYIPAERNLTGVFASSLANMLVSNIPLPSPLIEYMSVFERAKNHFTTYDASFLGVKYNKNFGDECISLVDNSDKHIQLEACSSGIQSALPMLMVLDYLKEGIGFDTIVIEEPEQNLFPTNQREILNRIILLSNSKKDCNIIINTHSPYLLSALNVSMLAAKLSSIDEYKGAVNNIVNSQFQINSTEISVFSLGEATYCKSILDDKTGLISINYLDLVSDTINLDFNRLYEIYLKMLRR